MPAILLGNKINVDTIVFLNSISKREKFRIIQVAKLFGSKIKFVPARLSERYASALTNMNLSNKVYKLFGSIKLNKYIKDITNSQ